MNAVSNEKRPTLISFYIRPTGTQISRGFKVHNLMTCESKVKSARTDDASLSNVRGASWRQLMQSSEQVNNIAQITAQK